jgi:hypothetical protein
MAASDPMSIEERRKYLMRMERLYRKAGKRERGALLDEMEMVTGMHRKSLTRLLKPGVSLERKPWRGRRKRSYGPEVQDVVAVVWESLDYVCAERLTPVLRSTAQHLATFGEVKLTPEIEEQLSTISRATVARMLGRLRQYRGKLPRKGPGKANKVRAKVPIGVIAWDTAEPGHFETDLVHHCGRAPVGTYVHTLQLIDIATGWSERVAVLGRSDQAMVDGFTRIETRLPFAIKEIHPDNGSEFFNHLVVSYFGRDVMPVHLSRSRPFHKNDNRFVEQRTAHWSGRTSGHGALTLEPGVIGSMLCMTRCGSTTTYSSRSCTWLKSVWRMVASDGNGMSRRRRSSGCWRLVSSLRMSSTD